MNYSNEYTYAHQTTFKSCEEFENVKDKSQLSIEKGIAISAGGKKSVHIKN